MSLLNLINLCIRFIILSTLLVVNVSANYTPEDIKNMKMIFCGVCKDEAVRKDLTNFADCAAKVFPGVAQKVLAIRTDKKDDQDACLAEVITVFKDFVKDNVDAAKKGEQCFHSNVKKEDLVNCH